MGRVWRQLLEYVSHFKTLQSPMKGVAYVHLHKLEQAVAHDWLLTRAQIPAMYKKVTLVIQPVSGLPAAQVGSALSLVSHTLGFGAWWKVVSTRGSVRFV